MVQRHLLFVVPVVSALSAAPALAQIGVIDGQQAVVFHARLNGYHEVPSISTQATGEFEVRLDTPTGALSYTLTYRNLESPAQQAHIHFGQPGVNGGVSVWLCSNLPAPPPGAPAAAPPGTQACPQTTGTITGTVQATDVVGPAAQGIAAGEIAELLSAMNVGATYVNVHSVAYPNGEIRGQIREQSLGDDSGDDTDGIFDNGSLGTGSQTP